MPAYWSLDDGRVHVMGSPVPGTDRAIAYGVSEGGWAAGATDTFISDEERRSSTPSSGPAPASC